nr:dihydropteroate synthase [Oceanococcus sp. HetDA_MAG_MS8]
MKPVQLLGVLNVTPDSFSDGGCYLQPTLARARARELWEQGADWVDVGAESTRPGAPAVSEQEELRRLREVFTELQAAKRPWSIDTQKPAVMSAAIAAGASMVNDVNALQAPGALEACAGAPVAVVLMHRQGDAATMQQSPHYADVVSEVLDFLRERKEACLRVGIPESQIICDPGIGFGKTLQHNLQLLRATARLRAELAAPLLIGVSRKSMFRDLLGLDSTDARILPSVQTAVWAANQGAEYLRVHDVLQTRQGLKLWQALNAPDPTAWE